MKDLFRGVLVTLAEITGTDILFVGYCVVALGTVVVLYGACKLGEADYHRARAKLRKEDD